MVVVRWLVRLADFNLPNVDVVVTVGAPFEVPPMRWAANEKVNKKQTN